MSQPVQVASTATGLGLGVGQGLAGFLGPAHGWRLPFLIVSAPAFVFATLCFFLEEPERGSKESAILGFRSNEVIGDNEQCRELDDMTPKDCTERQDKNNEYEELKEMKDKSK